MNKLKFSKDKGLEFYQELNQKVEIFLFFSKNGIRATRTQKKPYIDN